jgi:ketosteroid isomerase-like protein
MFGLALLGVVFSSCLMQTIGPAMGQGQTDATVKTGDRRASIEESKAALTDLVRRFTTAQQTFDVAALKALTSEDYIEVSPVGELDPREKMLGFYAPEHKTDGPPLAVSDISVRLFGDCGVVIATLSFTVQGRTVEMRSTYVAHNESSEWKLVSAQATGIRPKATKQSEPKPVK